MTRNSFCCMLFFVAFAPFPLVAEDEPAETEAVEAEAAEHQELGERDGDEHGKNGDDGGGEDDLLRLEVLAQLARALLARGRA